MNFDYDKLLAEMRKHKFGEENLTIADIADIKKRVKEHLEEYIGENFEDVLALEVHSAVSDYDPEWCVEEETLAYARARDVFLDAVIDSLFANK